MEKSLDFYFGLMRQFSSSISDWDEYFDSKINKIVLKTSFSNKVWYFCRIFFEIRNSKRWDKNVPVNIHCTGKPIMNIFLNGWFWVSYQNVWFSVNFDWTFLVKLVYRGRLEVCFWNPVIPWWWMTFNKPRSSVFKKITSVYIRTLHVFNMLANCNVLEFVFEQV